MAFESTNLTFRIQIVFLFLLTKKLFFGFLLLQKKKSFYCITKIKQQFCYYNTVHRTANKVLFSISLISPVISALITRDIPDSK